MSLLLNIYSRDLQKLGKFFHVNESRDKTFLELEEAQKGFQTLKSE